MSMFPTTGSPVPPAPSATALGAIVTDLGTRADYHAIARHHYRDRAPATFCAIRAAWHIVAAAGAEGPARRLVGVAVLSWPVANIPARTRHFRLPDGYGARLRFANANCRTVSRVIVHPQFRGLGVASRLVRELIDVCPTRYVESSAAMGRYATFLTAAGMTLVPATRDDEPAYFLCDRHRLDGAIR